MRRLQLANTRIPSVRGGYVSPFKVSLRMILLVACLLLFSHSLQAGISAQERNALIDFYHATDGTEWKVNSGWLGDPGTECSWYGITCDTEGTTVTGLSVPMNEMYGIISPSLGKLANLETLSLFGNHLTGSMPRDLGYLSNLRILYLHVNSLSGAIPPEVGQLANLRDLRLHQNHLTNAIPPELGALSNLNTLYLNYNHLSGTIPPELGALRNLQDLNLCSNELTGNIPKEIGNLTNLVNLDFQSNRLTGIIPSALGDLTNLHTLTIGQNRLTGTMPSTLGNLSNLQTLAAESNLLAGSIPSALGELINLKTLMLSSNLLTGTIPPNFGDLINLEILYLNENHLTGSVPPTLGNLAKLRWLRLESNRLTGNLPTQLSNLFQSAFVISWNALYANDSNLMNFLNFYEPGWLNTQTVAPVDVATAAPSSTSIRVYWTPILYTADAGRYEVYLSTTSSGPFSLSGSTAYKTAASCLITGLNPATTYYVYVRTVTDPHEHNSNTVVSESSPVFSATTLPVANLFSILVTTFPVGQTFVADGKAYSTSQTFSWTAGSNHTIAVNSPQGSGTTRYVFSDWSDGGAISHTLITPNAATTYTANFTTQYQLITSALPASGGDIVTSPNSSDGFYASETTVLLTANANRGYVFSGWSGDLAGTTNPQSMRMSSRRNVVASFSPPQGSYIDLTLASGGAARAVTVGSSGQTQSGYATVTMSSGTAPYGTAVFSYRQNGIVVSEAGVPASPPTTAARIFVDYRTRASVPGSTGPVDIDTGFAVVNHGDAIATITFTLRNLVGQTVTTGIGTLAKDAHMAKFINQLTDVPGFSIPAEFPTSTRFGTLEMTSDQPLSVVALRLSTNQRGDTLLTSTPIADLTKTPSTGTVYFPQLADGGGSSTSIILMNTSNAKETGILHLYSDDGLPLVVQSTLAPPDSQFSYSIEPGGAYLFQTDASPINAKVGWVELVPGQGTSTPVAAGIFQYSSKGILVTESGIPSTTPTVHARVFIDTTSGHDTGFALGNPGSLPVNIVLAAYPMDSSTQTGVSKGPIALAAKGHAAAFVDQKITELPIGFRGVLDISSNSPFAALTLRSLTNERDDFLMTTFPVADMTSLAPAPLIVPQIADGGGYITEIILLSAGASCQSTVHFFDNMGAPLQIGK